MPDEGSRESSRADTPELGDLGDGNDASEEPPAAGVEAMDPPKPHVSGALPVAYRGACMEENLTSVVSRPRADANCASGQDEVDPGVADGECLHAGGSQSALRTSCPQPFLLLAPSHRGGVQAGRHRGAVHGRCQGEPDGAHLGRGVRDRWCAPSPDGEQRPRRPVRLLGLLRRPRRACRYRLVASRYCLTESGTNTMSRIPIQISV